MLADGEPNVKRLLLNRALVDNELFWALNRFDLYNLFTWVLASSNFLDFHTHGGFPYK